MKNSISRTRWTILKNQLGLQGKETINVVVNYLFVNAFFNIEREYDKDIRFSLRKGGDARYKLHHITSTDICVMIILQKICDVRGKIQNVSLADICQAINQYFEKPCCETQVYVSLQKFAKNKLIIWDRNELTGRVDIWLNHYIDPQTDKPGHLVVAHNFVFSKEFAELPVAAQKLYISCLFRKYREMQSFPLFNNGKEDIQWNNILKFLHLSDTSQLKKILHICIDGKPLFYITTPNHDFKKAAGKYCIAEFKVNPDFTEQENTIGNGVHYHQPIKPRCKYKRIKNYLVARANNKGIGEITQHKHFPVVVQQLRKVSRKVVDVVLNKIRDEVVLNGKIPFELSKFVKTTIIERRDGFVLIAAKEKKLQHFVRPVHLDYQAQLQTEYRFLELLRRYRFNQIQEIFIAAQHKINTFVAKELANCGLKDYQYVSTSGKAFDHVVEAYAYSKGKSSPAYQRLILDFNAAVEDCSHVLYNMSQKERTNWLLDRVDELPSIKEAPSAIRYFDLNEFILSTFPLQPTDQLSHPA